MMERKDYRWLMEFCIHCGHDFENHDYAGIHAYDWSVQCGHCGEYQERPEYRKYFHDATGEDLGDCEATL